MLYPTENTLLEQHFLLHQHIGAFYINESLINA